MIKQHDWITDLDRLEQIKEQLKKSETIEDNNSEQTTIED